MQIDIFDICSWRAVAQPLAQGFQLRLVTLGFDINTAVGFIANDAFDTSRTGKVAGAVTKTNTLYFTANFSFYVYAHKIPLFLPVKIHFFKVDDA